MSLGHNRSDFGGVTPVTPPPIPDKLTINHQLKKSASAKKELYHENNDIDDDDFLREFVKTRNEAKLKNARQGLTTDNNFNIRV